MSERRRLCITKRACIPLVLLLVALVGGAIVNVAVAWCSAAFIRPLAYREVILKGNNGRFFFVASRTAHTVRCLFWCNEVPASVVDEVRSEYSVEAPPSWSAGQWSGVEKGGQEYQEEARGWPALGLTSGVRFARASTTPTVINAISLPDWPGGAAFYAGASRPLPLRPIWPGFAINTVFYAFILWLLFALGGTPFALRRRRRIKRGLCPKCAYPVGTNEVCTECGAAHDDAVMFVATSRARREGDSPSG